jgi:hypothetical protein
MKLIRLSTRVLYFFTSLVLIAPGVSFAQSKIKFPYSITSKSLGYGPMLASAKLGFMEREGG